MYFRRHSRWKSVSFQRRYRGLMSAKMPYIYYKFCYVRSPNQDGAKTRGRVYFQLSYVMSSRRFKLSFWQCSSKALYKIDRICSSNSTRQQVRLKRCVDLFPVSSLPLTQGQVVYLKKKKKGSAGSLASIDYAIGDKFLPLQRCQGNSRDHTADFLPR